MPPLETGGDQLTAQWDFKDEVSIKVSVGCAPGDAKTPRHVGFTWSFQNGEQMAPCASGGATAQR
jgi:hypothetical protein